MLATTPAPIFTHEWWLGSVTWMSLVAPPPNPYVTCLQPEVHRCTNRAYAVHLLLSILIVSQGSEGFETCPKGGGIRRSRTKIPKAISRWAVQRAVQKFGKPTKLLFFFLVRLFSIEDQVYISWKTCIIPQLDRRICKNCAVLHHASGIQFWLGAF